jgi:hypothetical protein
MVPGVFRDAQVNCLYTTCYSNAAISTLHEGMELYPVQLRPLPQAHAPAIQPHSSQGSSSSSAGTYKPSQLGTSMCHSAQDRTYYTQGNCLYTTCYGNAAISTLHEGMELYPVQLRPLPQAHAPAIQPHSSQGSSSSSAGTYKPSQLGTSMCHSAQDRTY